jgi:hypothetical protein
MLASVLVNIVFVLNKDEEVWPKQNPATNIRCKQTRPSQFSHSPFNFLITNSHPSTSSLRYTMLILTFCSLCDTGPSRNQRPPAGSTPGHVAPIGPICDFAAGV